MATPAFLYAIVLAMGAIGATLRYLIELAIPTEAFPAGTLLINLVGCYIIYIVYQWFDRRVHIPHSIARGIGVGLVGAFTTLSAFCTESLALLQTGEYLMSALYVSATVFSTFLASLAGWATCSLLAYRKLKQLQRRRMQHHLEMQRAAQSESAHQTLVNASAPKSNSKPTAEAEPAEEPELPGQSEPNAKNESGTPSERRRP